MKQGHSPFKDFSGLPLRGKVAAGAFVLQVQLIIGVSIFFGQDAILGISNAGESLGLEKQALWRVIGLGFFSVLVSCTLSVTAEAMLSRKLGELTLLLAPLVAGCIILTSGQDATRSTTTGTVFSALLLALLSSLCYRNQLQMASATLHVSIKAARETQAHPLKLHALAILSVLYTICWTVATVGIITWTGKQKYLVPCYKQYEQIKYQNMSFDFFVGDTRHQSSLLCEKESSVHPTCLLLLVAALFWTREVFKNWTYASASNHVGSWWTNRPPRRVKCLITYLDYVSSESLVIPSLRLIGMLTQKDLVSRRLICRFPAALRGKREQDEPSVNMNSWYFVFLGTYASRSTTTNSPADKESEQHNFGPVRNNRSAFVVLLLYKISIALFCGKIASAVDDFCCNNDDRPSSFLAFFVSFVIGYITAGAMLANLEGAAKTVLVCFSESFPEEDFHKTRLAFQLKKVSQQVYPSQHQQNELPQEC